MTESFHTTDPHGKRNLFSLPPHRCKWIPSPTFTLTKVFPFPHSPLNTSRM